MTWQTTTFAPLIRTLASASASNADASTLRTATRTLDDYAIQLQGSGRPELNAVVNAIVMLKRALLAPTPDMAEIRQCLAQVAATAAAAQSLRSVAHTNALTNLAALTAQSQRVLGRPSTVRM